MTNDETVDALLGAMHLDVNRTHMRDFVERAVEELHSAGYMLAPSVCPACDRWLDLHCAVCGAIPD